MAKKTSEQTPLDERAERMEKKHAANKSIGHDAYS